MKKIVVALLAILSVFTFATPAQAASKPRLTVIGDSLVAQMCGHANEAIPTRRVPVTDVGCLGWSGVTSGGVWQRTIQPNWVDPLNSIKPTNSIPYKQALNNADVIVIGLGTNNALRQQPLEWFGWDIDNIMREANGRKVVWFDIGMRVQPGALGNWDQWRSADQHNGLLWSKTAQWPNLHVLPWGGTIGNDPGLVQQDGIHTTDRGTLKRWEMVKNAINS